MECIFCQIIAGKIPSQRIYEDDRCIAFLDIHPINPGHVLVIPRRHVERFYDLRDEEAAHLGMVTRKIYRAVRQTDVSCEGANIFLSDGEVAGQEVKHCHFHIAPRFTGDGHRTGFSRTHPQAGNPEELAAVAEKIKKNLVGQSNK